jgi:1-acyl-sn-glycerol-3-phosphate acyltransferase
MEGPPPSAADLRHRLEGLEQRLESAALRAAERLGELARQEASGDGLRELKEALASLVPALRQRFASLASLRALVAGPGELDFFGIDRELCERAMPLLDFLYGSWWRVATRSIENVPEQGPAVVVANHGGALPWDALVLRLALLKDHPARRELRPLLDARALQLPVAGPLAGRLGAVLATPENALGLLADARAVAVFPEGTRAGPRPWAERYRVDRFGRGGFVKIALRAGAPIVPCAIVGSEETSASLVRPGWIADRLGLPVLATAPALPLGALGLLPLPSRWTVRFGEPVDTRGLDAAAADDPAVVLDLTERTRAALQAMLDEDVAARRSVYL